MRIAEAAIKKKVPTIHGLREMVDAGGLASYGASFHDLYPACRGPGPGYPTGRNPSDLPIEQPVKFELILNAGTARAIGLTLNPLVLARADEVID